MGLWPRTEPNHIFYWNYNWLKHTVGGCLLWVVAPCSDHLAAAHYWMVHAVPKTLPQRTTRRRTLFWWPSGSALPNGALCSPDQDTAHYRIAHAGSMALPQRTNHTNFSTNICFMHMGSLMMSCFLWGSGPPSPHDHWQSCFGWPLGPCPPLIIENYFSSYTPPLLCEIINRHQIDFTIFYMYFSLLIHILYHYVYTFILSKGV